MFEHYMPFKNKKVFTRKTQKSFIIEKNNRSDKNAK